jgi:hypothetical protein
MNLSLLSLQLLALAPNSLDTVSVIRIKAFTLLLIKMLSITNPCLASASSSVVNNTHKNYNYIIKTKWNYLNQKSNNFFLESSVINLISNQKHYFTIEHSKK